MTKHRFPEEEVSLVEERAPPAPAEAPAEEPAVDPNFMTFPLRKPIQVFADRVSTLKLRLPTGGDMIKIGNPVLINIDPATGQFKYDYDMSRMGRMIAQLANIPTVSLDMMDSNDLAGISFALLLRFQP